MREWLKKKLPHWVLRKRWSDYYWREFNGDGERELQKLPTLVSETKTAIDIGGSVGTYTFHLSRLANKVVTFEPNPALHWRYQVLKLPNVQLERVALSSSGDTTTELAVPESPDMSGLASIEPDVRDKHADFNRVTVPLRTLDSYKFKNIGFMKIDVEGHEESVLQGASETIKENKPILLIEIEERHNQGGISRVVEFMSGLGYKTYFYDRDELTPYDTFDLEKHQSDEAADNAGSGRVYINNFVFKPELN